MTQRVFASWSGGKDSCLSCYHAMTDGLDIRYLTNMVTEDGKRSCSHGISADVIRVQSEAIGIPLLQRPTTRETYEAEFKNTIQSLKQERVKGGVFGDIDFNEHRQWIERVCRETGIIPYLPLWGESHDKVMKDFVNLGFESVIIAAKSDFFGEDILGRKLDMDFIKHLEELKKTKDITLCGEAGEYHTVVIDGPLFQKRVEIMEAEKILRDGIWFLEILKVEIKDRRPD
ncbi:diphthine--ammonia ligase [Chloroflexota bacterium]